MLCNSSEERSSQDRQCTYKNKNKARSRNHCCREKQYHLFRVCVCSLVIQHAKHMRHITWYIDSCGLSGSTILFLHYLINGTIIL